MRESSVLRTEATRESAEQKRRPCRQEIFGTSPPLVSLLRGAPPSEEQQTQDVSVTTQAPRTAIQHAPPSRQPRRVSPLANQQAAVNHSPPHASPTQSPRRYPYACPGVAAPLASPADALSKSPSSCRTGMRTSLAGSASRPSAGTCPSGASWGVGAEARCSAREAARGEVCQREAERPGGGGEGETRPTDRVRDP